MPMTYPSYDRLKETKRDRLPHSQYCSSENKLTMPTWLLSTP